MTLPGRPTSPPDAAPRPTVAQAIAAHPAYPWSAALMGLALMAAGAWLVYRQFPATLADKVFDGSFLVVGLCILPTMPTRLAAGIKQVGGSLADAWRARQ